MLTSLSLFQLVYSLNHLAIFSRWLSLFLGEYLIYILGMGTVLYLILNKESKKDDKGKWLLILVLAGCLSNLVITPLVHYLYKSPRPFVLLSEIDSYKYLLRVAEYNTSFPSDHTSLAFAIALVLFLKNKRVGILALIMATLVGLGRILMGVHWPLDILGGIGVGIVCALIAYKIMETLVTKTTPKK